MGLGFKHRIDLRSTYPISVENLNLRYSQQTRILWQTDGEQFLPKDLRLKANLILIILNRHDLNQSLKMESATVFTNIFFCKEENLNRNSEVLSLLIGWTMLLDIWYKNCSLCTKITHCLLLHVDYAYLHTPHCLLCILRNLECPGHVPFII